MGKQVGLKETGLGDIKPNMAFNCPLERDIKYQTSQRATIGKQPKYMVVLFNSLG